jgi:hypothetical protein
MQGARDERGKGKRAASLMLTAKTGTLTYFLPNSSVPFSR